jgi:hypothetical protein
MRGAAITPQSPVMGNRVRIVAATEQDPREMQEAQFPTPSDLRADPLHLKRECAARPSFPMGICRDKGSCRKPLSVITRKGETAAQTVEYNSLQQIRIFQEKLSASVSP